MADMLSMVALKLKKLSVEKLSLEDVSGFLKCETKLQI